MATATEKTKAQATPLAQIKRDTIDKVADKISQFVTAGTLHLPADYSVDNALKAAWLVLQDLKDKNDRPALQVCSQASVYNALLYMAIQGLNVSKNQCYLIVYGTSLVCQRSYFGDMTLAQRVCGGGEFYGSVIYADDDVEYEILRGKKIVVHHKQKLENVDPAKIVGAYGLFEGPDGQVLSAEVMTIERIRQSWTMSKTYRADNPNVPHNKFTDDFCLRTVTRRVCKPIINRSTDRVLMDAIKQSDLLAAEAEIDEEAAMHANSISLDFPEVQVAEQVGEILEPVVIDEPPIGTVEAGF